MLIKVGYEAILAKCALVNYGVTKIVRFWQFLKAAYFPIIRLISKAILAVRNITFKAIEAVQSHKKALRISTVCATVGPAALAKAITM